MVLGRCIFELVDLESIRIVTKIVLVSLVGRKLLHDNDHNRKYVIFKGASGICGRHIGQTREGRLPVLMLLCSESIFRKSHQDASLYL